MADYSFPKQNRLLNAADYKAVFSNAQFKVSCRYFLILAIKNNWTHSRLGLVIAKKNVAKAVQRNRVKRIVREFFRHHSAQDPGLDLVVLTRKDVDTLQNSQISARLATLWADLNKLHLNDKRLGAVREPSL
ncbi:MAG: ribonuclease P protein component [Gammaproteobacteria bacterium]|nr:ribonuclease P protein component [Gammaproteobacteria bacterium]